MVKQSLCDRLNTLLERLIVARGQTYDKRTNHVLISHERDRYGKPSSGQAGAYFLYDRGDDYEQYIWLGQSFVEAERELRAQIEASASTGEGGGRG